MNTNLEIFVERALDAIQREYPHHPGHVQFGDADARPPRELSPAFHGAFDWHSAVHGHWTLVRALRLGLGPPLAQRATEALTRSFEPRALEGERVQLSVPGREGFERPYGLAWLLQLAAELREEPRNPFPAWREALEPLESLAADRFRTWLPRLAWPVRSGEHSQTAFALGLVLDWARTARAVDLEQMIVARAGQLYGRDRDAPVAYEPSGHDFLSPILGEADLMRRVLPADRFGEWLDGFLPDLGGEAVSRWLTPVVATDRADGKLAHLDGLNLSRAWMLAGIAAALPASDPRAALLGTAADRHGVAGLDAAAATTEYAGTHWLGSFALYLATGRGIAGARTPGGVVESPRA